MLPLLAPRSECSYFGKIDLDIGHQGYSDGCVAVIWEEFRISLDILWQGSHWVGYLVMSL